MTPVDWHARKAFIADIEAKLAPDTFITATLAQAVLNDSGHPVYGNVYDYQKVASRYIARLSKCLIKRPYKRFGKVIDHAIFLEGDRRIKRYHFHMCLRRPDHIAFDAFSDACTDIWLSPSLDWTLPDIQVKPREGSCIAYSTKEGYDAWVSLSY